MYHDFSQRWIGLSRLISSQWLGVIRLFELEVSARMIAKQTGVACNTAHRTVTILRMAVMAHAEDADILLSGGMELDESCFGGKRKGKRGRRSEGKVPVSGILSRGSKVFVQVAPNCRAETLLGLTVKKVRRGSMIHTDKYKVYDALMCCGYRHLAVDYGKCSSNGEVHINGPEGFWSFARERLIKHHGVSGKFFPLLSQGAGVQV